MSDTSDTTRNALPNSGTIEGLRKELFASLVVTGDLLKNAGRTGEAESAYRRALDLEPSQNAIRFRLARTLIENDSTEEAEICLRDLVKQTPQDREVTSWLAGLLTMDGKVSEGNAVMRAHYQNYPIVKRQGPVEQQPPLLMVRGFSNTMTLLGHDTDGGPLRPGFRGGNFSHTHLLRDPSYTIIDYTVANQNLLDSEAHKTLGIPNTCLILNTIADADIEQQSLETLDTFLEENPHPVINHPSEVLKTTRDSNWRRFKDRFGFLFPTTHRISLQELQPNEILEKIKNLGFKLPLILRRAGTHTARSTVLAKDWNAVAAVFEETKEDFSGGLKDIFYVTQFVDCRGRDNTYNKKRFFWIDGTLYPVVSHVDRMWNVHGSNRREVLRKTPWMVEQEKQFLREPAKAIGVENFKRIEALCKDTGLDFVGIDFTVLQDGRVMVFELNPAMRHSFDHARNTPHLTPYLEAISTAFEEMVKRRLPAY